ncbi:hypothetical protein GCM10010340_35910 [Streptomyces griseoloalbus]|nr:hypothetical protein GCM10010294_58410 [Streptomyces griseoloalbus]GGW54178.1 hypothetical protein GCM10010340_35910 [Streptomyces albaduncus]
MDALTHPLRELGGGTRLAGAAEESSCIRPRLSGPSSDVLSGADRTLRWFFEYLSLDQFACR